MTHSQTTLVAIELCRRLEAIAPDFGYHVALTGGCLYKDGPRKDIDVLFYSVRQCEAPDRAGLVAAIQRRGILETGAAFGWMLKGTHKGLTVDMFFPETPKSSLDQYAGDPGLDVGLCNLIAAE